MAMYSNDLIETFDEKLGLQTTPQKTNALTNKITSVLSASYADSEIRDAVRTLDDRNIQNTAETRRGIRLEVQKEVIQRNGDIIKDFGNVAEVRVRRMPPRLELKWSSATQAHRRHYQESEQLL